MLIKSLKKIRIFLLRNIIWRRFEIGEKIHVGRGVTFWARNSLRIGNNVYVGRYSSIECDAEIGDEVLISNFVQIVGRYDHHFLQVGSPIRSASQIRDNDYDWRGLNSKVVIEDDVWIGVGAVILSGVVVGAGAIISAGAVVTKNVPSYSIVGGNPARVISQRFSTDEAQTHEDTWKSMGARP